MAKIKEYVDSNLIKTYENMSLREFLRTTTLQGALIPNDSTKIKWFKDPRIKSGEEEKELSTEELFNNVKKELNKIKKM